MQKAEGMPTEWNSEPNRRSPVEYVAGADWPKVRTAMATSRVGLDCLKSGTDNSGRLRTEVLQHASGRPPQTILRSHSYDANGDLTAVPSQTLTYDAENRMIQAVHSSNGTDRYVYDPSNLRVWK